MSAKLVACLLFALASVALADDLTRAVQQKLKDGGFYYGEVNGQGGSETAAALRRYQIRYGLRITGEPNDETLRALGLGRGRTAEVPRPSPAPPVGRPVPDARPLPTPTPVPRIDPPPFPPDRYPEPPGREDAPFSQFSAGPDFVGTVYERAPAALQENVLFAAQGQLARRGFYRGAPDGQPGPATADALARFQRDRDLPVTGRLDEDTLDELQLLPGQRNGPPARTGRFDRTVPPRQVYRGIWIDR